MTSRQNAARTTPQGEPGREGGQLCGRTNCKATADSPTAQRAAWLVLIDAKRTGMLWGRYTSRALAAATVRDLRKHGFVARVVGPDDLDLLVTS